MSEPIFILTVAPGLRGRIQPRDIQAEIDRLWAEARTDLTLFTGDPAAEKVERPFQASPSGGALDAASAIVISVATPLVSRILVDVWKDVIWPALKRKFGSDIQEKS